MRLVAASLIALVLAQVLHVAAGHAQDPPAEGDARLSLTRRESRVELGVSSGIFLPPEGGRLGFALAGDASYGVPLGRAYLAPGVRVASFIRSGLVAIAPLVTTRVGAHVDLFRGTVDPYLLGGVGVGHLSESSHEGFAYQFGGGVTASVGARLSVGAELVYLGIVGSDFRALFLGPRVTLAL